MTHPNTLYVYILYVHLYITGLRILYPLLLQVQSQTTSTFSWLVPSESSSPQCSPFHHYASTNTLHQLGDDPANSSHHTLFRKKDYQKKQNKTHNHTIHNISHLPPAISQQLFLVVCLLNSSMGMGSS